MAIASVRRDKVPTVVVLSTGSTIYCFLYRMMKTSGKLIFGPSQSAFVPGEYTFFQAGAGVKRIASRFTIVKFHTDIPFIFCLVLEAIDTMYSFSLYSISYYPYILQC